MNPLKVESEEKDRKVINISKGLVGFRGKGPACPERRCAHPVDVKTEWKTIVKPQTAYGTTAMGSPTQPSAPGLRVFAAGRLLLFPMLRQLGMLALNVTVPKYSAPSELAVAYGTNTLSFKKLSVASNSASVKPGVSG
jgi:hypothetical protein